MTRKIGRKFALGSPRDTRLYRRSSQFPLRLRRCLPPQGQRRSRPPPSRSCADFGADRSAILDASVLLTSRRRQLFPSRVNPRITHKMRGGLLLHTTLASGSTLAVLTDESFIPGAGCAWNRAGRRGFPASGYRSHHAPRDEPAAPRRARDYQCSTLRPCESGETMA
jgi:hypothetical protein